MELPVEARRSIDPRLIGFMLCLPWVVSFPVLSADCNSNGVPDSQELVVAFGSHPIDIGSGSVANIIAADLDGDKDLDVVWALPSGGDARLLLRENNGAGSFGPEIVLYEGFSRNLQAGDMDNDGDVDLLADTGALSWFENLDGLGTLAAPVSVDPFGSRGSLGDMDGDGDLDIISFSNALDEVFEIENLGNGQFGTPVPIVAADNFWIQLADVDTDGLPDIVYRDNGGAGEGVGWIGNTGNGYSDPSVISNLPDPTDFATADLDGDGDIDVARAQHSPSSLVWHENTDGQGTFGPGQIVHPEQLQLHSIRAADLDGDGDRDLLGSTIHLFSYWWENLGGGVFASLQAAGGVGNGNETGLITAVADLDRDGLPDYLQASAEIFHDGTEFYDFVWYENLRDDCNANAVLDSCEADCNTNNVADACDLIVGSATDCDGSRTLDECDVACPACDLDGDGCPDEVDQNAVDPTLCADSDADMCDDCSSGTYDPGADGLDQDADGWCVVGDCDDFNSGAWAAAGHAGTLLAGPGPGNTVLWSWAEPGFLGATSVVYDVVGSSDPADLVDAAVCLETDDGDTLFLENSPPGPEGLSVFLVRVENACAGEGAMGVDSDGVPRSGLACP